MEEGEYIFNVLLQKTYLTHSPSQKIHPYQSAYLLHVGLNLWMNIYYTSHTRRNGEEACYPVNDRTRKIPALVFVFF
jgi:hypothetical protein